MTSTVEQLKAWFSTGKTPSQAHFWALLESFFHKKEDIPIENVSGAIGEDVLPDILDALSDDKNEATATLVATTEDNKEYAFKLTAVESWYGYGYGGKYGWDCGTIGTI